MLRDATEGRLVTFWRLLATVEKDADTAFAANAAVVVLEKEPQQ